MIFIFVKGCWWGWGGWGGFIVKLVVHVAKALLYLVLILIKGSLK